MPKTAQQRGDNRREFERVIPASDAPVRVNINGEGFIEVTNAVDISEGGIRIRVKHRFVGCAVDLPATVVIQLPGPVNRHFRFMGRIKHVLDDSFGVQFTALSDADRALVRRYIAAHVEQPLDSGFFQNSLRSLLRFVR